MGEFTKGPWHVEQQTEDDGVHVLICSAPGAEPGYPRESFCIAESVGETSPRGLANADLLAAAPELLEALECAKNTLYAWHQIGMGDDEAWLIYNDASPEMKQINAAIAKATGAQS